MSKSYAFRDLVTHSGASKNEVTNWVQKGLIRPDIRDTTGTGAHRSFGFLDVFEACVAAKLNQLPGGTPLHVLESGLAAIRLQTVFSELSPDPHTWGAFIHQVPHDPAARFWLVRFPDGVSRVLNRAERDALLNESADLLVVVRLDTLLVELEQRTDDHSTAEERRDAWTKRDGSVIESADTAGPTDPRAVDVAPIRRIAAKSKD